MKPKPLKVVNLDRQMCILRFSRDGKWLLASGQDPVIRRLDATTPDLKAQTPLSGHNGWVTALAVHPDGKRLLSADSWGRISCWPFSEATPKVSWSLAEAHDGWIRNLAISPDGQIVVSAGADGKVGVWSCADGKKVRELTGHNAEVYSVAIHPDGKTLVSGDCKGVVIRWDAATGKLLGEIDATSMYSVFALQELGGVRVLTFDRQGKWLILAGATAAAGKLSGPSILLYDWAASKLAHTVKFGATLDGYVYDVACHPDGLLMAVTSGQPGQGKLVFLKPGEATPSVSQALPNPHTLALHPDGKRLLVAATNAGSNGNGRNLNGSKEYPGNYSPLHIYELQ